MLEPQLTKQNRGRQSHQRHTVDPRRSLDTKTSNYQREPNDLEIGGVFPSVIDPNRNISRGLRTIWESTERMFCSTLFPLEDQWALTFRHRHG